MKRQTITILAYVAAFAIVAFIIVKVVVFAKPVKGEVITFLQKFSTDIKQNPPDSSLSYFDLKQKQSITLMIIKSLAGVSRFHNKDTTLFNVNLKIDNSNITILNGQFVEVKIPIEFTTNSNYPQTTSISFKLRHIGHAQFKIVKIDTKTFYPDFVAFANSIKQQNLRPDEMFSAVTLAAFKTAAQLKPRYDTVVWFAHLKDKTYFYVVNGKWDNLFDRRDKGPVMYKMGLVNPDLKEIIPPQFDLIHNINGTFDGLVEVEKDGKKGFYDLDGKIIIPVVYDQIIPIEDAENIAVLRKDNDYFYFKSDRSITDKMDIQPTDFFLKIKNITSSYELRDKALAVVTEHNSMKEHGAIYITPSYLVDLKIIRRIVEFTNPLRNVDFDAVSTRYEVSFNGTTTNHDNWLQASFYSIRDYFLGGRGEFYDAKNVVIVDKKRGKIYTEDIPTDFSPDGSQTLTGTCDVNSIKEINDSLFEVKAAVVLFAELYDTTKTVVGGTYFNYFSIKNNSMVRLPNNRNFGFTKYIKMDDSYLQGCYELSTGLGRHIKTAALDHVTPEMLRYMKNEIYADYAYKFKDKRWMWIFQDKDSYITNGSGEMKSNANVDDSLTEIDKYNIAFINQKLRGLAKPVVKTQTTLAAQ